MSEFVESSSAGTPEPAARLTTLAASLEATRALVHLGDRLVGVLQTSRAKFAATPAAATGGRTETAPKLNRRVPGANLTLPPPGPVVLGDRPGDPEEVRDLLNQFESGVARALTEVNSEHRHQEGPT